MTEWMVITAMKWMSKCAFLIKEGFVSIFSHGFMSFASVTIIMACLIIMGSFSLISVNIGKVINDLEDQNEILAYVDESLTENEARALEEKIQSINNVSKANFMSREEAMEEFSAKQDSTNLIEDIDPEVFRHRYIVYMEDLTDIEHVQKALLNVEGIAKVNASMEVARGLITARNIFNAICLVIAGILVLVSVFIMANTIKLTTFGRREEIAIMKMVGATDGFIRWPFVVEGLVLGGLGSLLAFFSQWGVYRLVSERVMESVAGKFVEVVPFVSVMYPILWIFVGIGAFVGTFGGIIAIRNYLKV